MSSGIVELKPNKNLLEPNFEGYKLELEPTPILRQDILVPPEHTALSESEYSFLDVHLASSNQNLLTQDPWNDSAGYFIDAEFTIKKIEYDTTNGFLKPLESPFQLTNICDNVENKHRSLLLFASPEYCVISDGFGNLSIVSTGDRKSNAKWEIQFEEHDVLNRSVKKFILQEVRLIKSDTTERTQIHCLLSHVVHLEKHTETVLTWTIYEKYDDNWKRIKTMELQGRSALFYASFDEKCDGITLACSKDFNFSYDCAVGVLNFKKETHEAVIGDDVSKLSWTQDDQEVTVLIVVKGITSEDINLSIEGRRLTITKSGIQLVEAELFDETKQTQWAVENNTIFLRLHKKDDSNAWPILYENGPQENFVLNPKDKDESAIPKPSNLISQIEDCDLGSSENDYFIDHLVAESYSRIHRVQLGSYEPLFSTRISADLPKAIVVRSDVDALIWQPNTLPTENWNLTHEGTLQALAYVQASKQHRKFTQCSPDMRYSVICEGKRHVFFYKMVEGSGLRRRNGPSISYGKQRVVTLDLNDEILGMLVANTCTILLTEKTILCLQFESEDV